MNEAGKEQLAATLAEFCPGCQPKLRALFDVGLEGLANGEGLAAAHAMGISVKVKLDAPAVKP